jgi:ABC-type branched-subunit amino acid transport system permease subunit
VINGFTAAVLGGFGSMPGAVLGGMLLGVLENLAPLYLPSGIRYSVPFLVLIAILLVRPAGCSAASSGERCEGARRCSPRWRAARAWPWLAPRYFVFLASLISSTRWWRIGLNILSGYTNQLSFGHAGFLAIGAYTAAVLAIARAGRARRRLARAGRLVTAAVGLAFGVPCLRLSGLYLTMATLAFGFVIAEAILNLDALTRGADGLRVPARGWAPGRCAPTPRATISCVTVAA